MLTLVNPVRGTRMPGTAEGSRARSMESPADTALPSPPSTPASQSSGFSDVGRDITLTAVVLLLLASGVALQQFQMWGAKEAWLIAADVGLVTSIIRSLASLRAGRLAVDIVAVFALLGTIIIGEQFAGAMVALMVCTGALLESIASHRAARGLSLLVSRAPTFARRHTETGIEVITATDVRIGETLWVAAGDVVPVDGRLVTSAVLDESSLTGEWQPASRRPGDTVLSGVSATGEPFTMVATATAEESTYAAIVTMVEQAQTTSAPLVRLADRWAVWFIGVTAGITVLTYVLAGSQRAVSVLVIATPCPLILAAPIALISGIAVAARAGVLVRNGAALEGLARATTALLDKTGTVTVGRPRVTKIEVLANGRTRADDVLELAASIEQASSHVLAASVVQSAVAQGLTLHAPTNVREVAGKGIAGTVDGKSISVGSQDWMTEAGVAVSGVPPASRDGDGTLVLLSVNRALAGALTLTDERRPGMATSLQRLRRSGITRMVMLTGDRESTAHSVATGLGLDEVLARVMPADKQRIARLEAQKAPTLMIGDGINDAPALAAADIGVAIAAHGASAASQAADVVLVHDRFDAIADARQIAQSSVRIAQQSVILGMALCGVGMIAAMLGFLPAAAGALAQEGIDLAAISWALRATRIRTTSQ